MGKKKHPISAFLLRNFTIDNEIGIIYLHDYYNNNRLLQKAPFIEYKSVVAKPFWEQNIWSEEFEKQLAAHERIVQPIIEKQLSINDGNTPLEYQELLEIVLYICMLNFRSTKFLSILPLIEQKVVKNLSLREKDLYITESCRILSGHLSRSIGQVMFNKEVVISSDNPVIFDDSNIFVSRHIYLPIGPTKLIKLDAHGIGINLSPYSLMDENLNYAKFNMQTILFAHKKIYFKPNISIPNLNDLKEMVIELKKWKNYDPRR
jgi:Protein of unknown function (DUF4238)